MKINKPSLEEVNRVDLSELFPLFRFFPGVVNGDKNYLDQPAGIEHYKLLGWLSKKFDNCIISEIGTCDGMGLLALSLNKSNSVISYDIMDYSQKHDVPSNGERVLCNKDFNFFDEIIKSKLIFYDAGHGGKEEMFFIKKLLEFDYQGIVVFDDINLNNEMKNFWSELKSSEIYTEDWTDVGHYEGTGLVFFNKKIVKNNEL